MKMIIQPALNLAAVHRTMERADLGPDASMLISEVRHALQAWNRHFAGRSRATCDIWWLREHLARLQGLWCEMGSWDVEVQREALSQQLRTMAEEEGRIVRARSHLSPAALASGLRTRLRTQVELLGLHVVDVAPLAVRPGFVRRTLLAIEEIRRDLVDLPSDDGIVSEIDMQIRVLRPVVERVEAAWFLTPPMNRVPVLAVRLNAICQRGGAESWDLLSEVEIQLAQLHRLGQHSAVIALLGQCQRTMDSVDSLADSTKEDLF